MSHAHEQVELPELGFTVDRGLENLIRTCWQRGITTFGSCIGTDDDAEDGYLAFSDPGAAERWDQLTEYACEWIDDPEVAPVAEVHFAPSLVPYLVTLLRLAPKNMIDVSTMSRDACR